MRKIRSLAKLVIKAEMRRKIIYFSILAACLIIIMSKSFTSITPGAERKFIIDISYTWINIIGILIVLVAATDVISGEEREKTDYYYKTNPVSDVELILGKFLGAAGVVLISVTIMQLFYLLFFGILFKQVSIDQLKAFLLMDFSFTLLVAIGIFASCLFSRFTSILFCISVYITGVLSSYVSHLAEHQGHEPEVSGLSDKLAAFISQNLPNFERFNVLEYIIVDYPIGKKLFWGAVSYGAVSIMVILFISYILWKLRNKLR